jgi:hypothetical protein
MCTNNRVSAKGGARYKAPLKLASPRTFMQPAAAISRLIAFGTHPPACAVSACIRANKSP